MKRDGNEETRINVNTTSKQNDRWIADGVAMKQYVQAFLKRFGLHERLQVSCLYDLYWSLIDRRILNRRSSEVRFYRSLLAGLQKGNLIIDCGANHGTKTDVFLRLGARVLAVEPDESSQETLKRKFLRHRFAKKPLVIIAKALSDGNTVETMWIESPGSALNTLSSKWVETLGRDVARFPGRKSFLKTRRVPTTTLEELFISHGVPFFVKIDVEGYELNVLHGLKREVPFLSFEVNLPEFLPEGLQCITALNNLAEGGRFNYAVDCERGLELNRWLRAAEFAEILKECTERSVEVFWKTRPTCAEKNEANPPLMHTDSCFSQTLGGRG